MKLEDMGLVAGRAAVMAIVNVTPDSFWAGSRTPTAEPLRERIAEAVAQGASVIDVGGYSSRPGADDVSPGEELRRVGRGGEAVRELAPAMPVSVDTFRASVVEGVVQRFGAVIVNDISAGELDPAMIPAVARLELPYIAMHMRGTPADMQGRTDYACGIVAEVKRYFTQKAARLREAGVGELILDPGFGFAKTVEQNYSLLKGLSSLGELGLPLLAGVSRKSMIYRQLGVSPAEALNGTTALHWECLRQGVRLLRVHDVREAVETVALFEAFRQAPL